MKCFAICILSLLVFVAFGKTYTNTTLWESLQKNCGKTRFDPRNQEEDDDRIINGTAAKLGQFPWSVRLGTIYKTGKTFFHCGGSLITTTVVISAAHCDEYGNIARLGQTYEAMGPQCESIGVCAPPYQDIKIKKYIFEDYCRVSHVDDLMLLELVRPAKLNNFVQTICLPPSSLPITGLIGKHVVVSGWGLRNGTDLSSIPKNLFYMVTPVLDPDECSLNFTSFDRKRQFCLNNLNNKAVCKGDSGSGVFSLVKSGNKVRAYLIGIVSYGKVGCGFHSVNTLVEYYLDNILAHIEKSIGYDL